MHDVIQQGLQALASQNTATRDLTIFCAVVLIYLLCVAWALVVVRQRATITVATGARIVALGVLAYLPFITTLPMPTSTSSSTRAPISSRTRAR